MPPAMPCGHTRTWELIERLEAEALDQAQMHELAAQIERCPECRILLRTVTALHLEANPLATPHCPVLEILLHVAGCDHCSGVVRGVQELLEEQDLEQALRDLLTPSTGTASAPGSPSLSGPKAAQVIYIGKSSMPWLRLALVALIVVAFVVPFRIQRPSQPDRPPGPPDELPVQESPFSLIASLPLPLSIATAHAGVWHPTPQSPTEIILPDRPSNQLAPPVLLPYGTDGAPALLLAAGAEIRAYQLDQLDAEPLWTVEAAQLEGLAELLSTEWRQYAGWLSAEREQARQAGDDFLSEWGAAIPSDLPFPPPSVLGAGDIDGDTLDELLIRVGTRLIWLGKSGQVVASWGPETGPMWPPHEVIMSDLDGDGQDEVITTASAGYLWRDQSSPAGLAVVQYQGQPRCWRGCAVYNADGTLRWSIALPHALNPRVLDLDRDGRHEIALVAQALRNGYQIDYAGTDRQAAATNFELQSIVSRVVSPQDDSRAALIVLTETAAGKGTCLYWQSSADGPGFEQPTFLVPPPSFASGPALARSRHFSLNPGQLDTYRTRLDSIPELAPAPSWTHRPGYFPASADYGVPGIVWETEPVPALVTGISPLGQVKRLAWQDGRSLAEYQLSDHAFGTRPVALRRHATILASGEIDRQPGTDFVVAFTNLERPEPGQIVLLDQDLRPLHDTADAQFRSALPFNGAIVLDTDADGLNEVVLFSDEVRVIHYTGPE